MTKHPTVRVGGGISRRETLRRLAAGLTAAAGRAAEAQETGPHTDYFGDLHNHNNVGYAQGSLPRTFEIAREHLDFFAFTPHAWWHDIKEFDLHIQDKWINGFAVTRARWNEVMQFNRKFDEPGKFVPIAGYEWHSTGSGDYHMLFPDLEAEMTAFNTLAELQGYARKRGCILIPHHPANRAGHRGANFALRDPRVSPLLEIFSEWGCAESDRAPFPYIRHSEGGRWTPNTLQALLAQGHRVGVIASTDDHLGYPGAYREGLAVVKAASLTREGIFDALRNRRTYAVTGDRIRLDFRLNGKVMGSELAWVPERNMEVSVTGWDQVDRIEVLRNNEVIHRDFPMDRKPSARRWDAPVLVRFEYGWGPWTALGIGGVADWRINIQVEGGELEALQPCFLAGPLEEGRRDRILNRTRQGVTVVSFTARKQEVDDVSQKAVVLKLRGNAATKLTFSLEAPRKVALTQTLGQLAESSEALFTAGFPYESALVHRAVFEDNFRSSFSKQDVVRERGADWYYVRVAQANGQMAWSSPIWVGS
jgi:uncharacterized protein DUF3604